MEKKTIIPIEINPRQVKTRAGKEAVVFDIIANDGNKYSTWDNKFVNTIQVGKEVEIEFEVTTSGKYTNYNIVTSPRQPGVAEVIENQRKIFVMLDKILTAVTPKGSKSVSKAEDEESGEDIPF